MKLPVDFRWKRGRQLGEGGQASVFEATDNTGKHPGVAAIKFLKKGKPAKAYERFAREVEAIQKCSHPFIVRTIDHSAPDDDLQFYVMEAYEGAKSLKNLIGTEHNPFRSNPLAAISLFHAIVDALCECEGHDIVHRDLSPANLLVLPDCSIRLIDFGLCQIQDGSRITLADEGVGTPNYLAPECESGTSERATIAADLYSAGKLLWSAITNEMAFAREKSVFGSHSMQERFKELPLSWHLVHIFERTIRAEPRNRFESAHQARAWATHVRRLILSEALPLEKIGNECPFCRVGSLHHFDKDWQVFHNPVPIPFTGVRCDYCGLALVRDTSIPKERIAARHAFE